ARSFVAASHARLLDQPPEVVKAAPGLLFARHTGFAPVGLHGDRALVPVAGQRREMPAVVQLAFAKLREPDDALRRRDGILEVDVDDALQAHLRLDALVRAGEDL